MMRRALTLALLVLLAGGARPAAADRSVRAAASAVERLLAAWQLDQAAALLAPLTARAPASWRVLKLQGELAFLRGDYAGALGLLKRAVRSNRTSAALKARRDRVANTLELTRDYVEHRSSGGHFRIFTSRGKDQLLARFAGETLEAIRAALKADLGFAPREAIRVEIYPGPEDLARVSPLRLRDIRRSGTIALCKYNRLMAVTPRALLRGYPWRDTLAHEYTHLVVTRMSANSVPIWLHEGLAKHFEARWRATHGASAPLAPQQEHLLAQALRSGTFVPWARMHPSMAMLPSQRATALAFAQVQTAVEFLTGRVGLDGLRRVVGAVAGGRSSWEAIRQHTGLDRRAFTRQWKRYLRGRKLRAMPGLSPRRRRFGKKPSRERRLAAVRAARARRHLRLAELLRQRRLTRAAIIEYEKARQILGPRDDLVANSLARAYLEVSSPAQAISALMPVLEYYPHLSGPQVTMGIAHLRSGDAAAAARHLKVALAVNPFDPQIHCGLARALATAAPSDAVHHASLCARLQ